MAKTRSGRRDPGNFRGTMIFFFSPKMPRPSSVDRSMQSERIRTTRKATSILEENRTSTYRLQDTLVRVLSVQPTEGNPTPSRGVAPPPLRPAKV